MAPHEETEEGASPSELLIEACRRDNTELLAEVIASCDSAEKAAALLNETKTVLGNHLYHEAASRGNSDVIDMLLDQDGFECDPINRSDGDTPLHSVVRWINAESQENWEFGAQLLQMMLDAGSDPRIKNKALLTPYTLTDPRNTEVRKVLADAEVVIQNQGDFIVHDDVTGYEAEGQDDDAAYSGSDSDFDEEDYKKELAKRKQEKAAKAQAEAENMI